MILFDALGIVIKVLTALMIAIAVIGFQLIVIGALIGFLFKGFWWAIS